MEKILKPTEAELEMLAVQREKEALVKKEMAAKKKLKDQEKIEEMHGRVSVASGRIDRENAFIKHHLASFPAPWSLVEEVETIKDKAYNYVSLGDDEILATITKEVAKYVITDGEFIVEYRKYHSGDIWSSRPPQSRLGIRYANKYSGQDINKISNRAYKNPATVVKKCSEMKEQYIQSEANNKAEEKKKASDMEAFSAMFPNDQTKYENKWESYKYAKNGGFYVDRYTVTFANGASIIFGPTHRGEFRYQSTVLPKMSIEDRIKLVQSVPAYEEKE